MYWRIVWSIGLPLALLTAGHAVLRKRDPRSAGLWICLSFLLPVAGPVLYYLFGINRTTRRARRRMRKYRYRTKGGAGFTTTAQLPESAEHLDSLVRLADRILREPLVGGNSFEPLFDGEQAYPVMLEAIKTARHSITCCVYIFDLDEVGRQFINALASAANRGVQVKLLIDAVGGYWHWSKVWKALNAHGLRPASFAPVGLTPTRLVHINLRNHRKILVVDGRMGFTGGMNISAIHLARNTSNPDRFKDLQFQIRGPVVAQLQNAFADDWHFATGEQLEGEAFFPMLDPEGTALARGIADGPDENLRRLSWIFIGACNAAKDSIRIMTPYFIPSTAIKTAILGAVLRGVEVTLIVPHKSDQAMVNWASTAYLWEFLEHGVHVVRHAPPFHHTKVTVVDNAWTYLGSANLDPRSLRLNFEFNCEVYDANLAQAMARHLEAVASEGETLTLAKVDARSLPIKLRDGFMKLFSPYL